MKNNTATAPSIKERATRNTGNSRNTGNTHNTPPWGATPTVSSPGVPPHNTLTVGLERDYRVARALHLDRIIHHLMLPRPRKTHSPLILEDDPQGPNRRMLECLGLSGNQLEVAIRDLELAGRLEVVEVPEGRRIAPSRRWLLPYLTPPDGSRLGDPKRDTGWGTNGVFGDGGTFPTEDLATIRREQLVLEVDRQLNDLGSILIPRRKSDQTLRNWEALKEDMGYSSKDLLKEIQNAAWVLFDCRRAYITVLYGEAWMLRPTTRWIEEVIDRDLH